MKFEVKRAEVEVTLVLTEREAIWLRDYVQNSLCDPKDEPLVDSEMRRCLFVGIHEAMKDEKGHMSH